MQVEKDPNASETLIIIGAAVIILVLGFIGASMA